MANPYHYPRCTLCDHDPCKCTADEKTEALEAILAELKTKALKGPHK